MDNPSIMECLSTTYDGDVTLSPGDGGNGGGCLEQDDRTMGDEEEEEEEDEGRGSDPEFSSSTPHKLDDNKVSSCRHPIDDFNNPTSTSTTSHHHHHSLSLNVA